MGRIALEAPGLRWVIVDGETRPVSAYAHLRPRERPEALCPLCERPVTMKLGSIRVHHAAHQPDAICAATQPETILHLNAKLYLAEQLRGASKLLVMTYCHSCDKPRGETWVKDWNDVQVEVSLDSRRPDIGLLRAGELIAAIEVRVTHAVDEEKARFYANAGIPWIEVQADEALYLGDQAWTADRPLPFIVANPEPDAWVCQACKKRAARELRRERYSNAGWDAQIRYGIIVDFYYPSGKRYRECFFIKEIINHQNGRAFCTLEKWESDTPVARRGGLLTEATLEFLKTACRENIKSGKPKGTQYGFPTQNWMQWREGSKFHPRDFDRYPFDCEWDEAKRQWKKVPPPASSKPVLLPYARQRRDNVSQIDWDALRAMRPPDDLLPALNNNTRAAKQRLRCRVCGQLTDDWVVEYGIDNTCKCRNCVD